MKVLTIKQPFASLIANGYKTYEFRSWKTKYRGELYIHAGNGIDKKCMDMVKEYELDYPNGYIIAKVNLVSCILVDEKMSKKLREENPKVYTQDYTGYYAWKLDNVQLLDNPIKVSGKLSIWNYEVALSETRRVK